MKFFFCGGLDCPEWLLAEIAVISRVSTASMGSLCTQIINQICTGAMNWSKITKATAEAEFDSSEAKQCISGLEYVLTNAGRFDCDEGHLADEMTMIGLSKEQGDILARTYKESKDRIREALGKKMMKLPGIQEVEWRVDFVVASSASVSILQPVVALELGVGRSGEEPKPLNLEITAEKFRTLHAELKQARELMKDASSA
eukprot:NODE_8064_length_725_cov_106.616279_g7812_i0.p1 GENE.NODE_8064_length_725_cov_106.616279_g7812_i0~~NODE_8064_length_725_cov_106.616279_g7812_i0.p1  ORF type:complete len:219 (+),score=64.44 NODE_8064_length_725_cov_106.616279_g7812_i0:55-657(+)